MNTINFWTPLIILALSGVVALILKKNKMDKFWALVVLAIAAGCHLLSGWWWSIIYVFSAFGNLTGDRDKNGTAKPAEIMAIFASVWLLFDLFGWHPVGLLSFFSIGAALLYLLGYD